MNIDSKLKEYADKFDKFQVIDDLKKEFKETFPDTPESSPDKEDNINYDAYENSSSDDDSRKKKSNKNKKNEDAIK
jgi:hypothetical protein